MAQVKVVTDSLSDIPKKIAKDLDIVDKLGLHSIFARKKRGLDKGRWLRFGINWVEMRVASKYDCAFLFQLA